MGRNAADIAVNFFVVWQRLLIRQVCAYGLSTIPPYHSKYTAIERYWAGLEKSWKGYLLSTVNTVLRRAANFFWKGMRTVVQLLDTAYKKGVKVCGDEKLQLEQRLQRSSSLQWWDITIHPKLGDL